MASEYSLVVERLVANQSAGVRFSLLAPGCSIVVVYLLWEHEVWVRFPAARIYLISAGVWYNGITHGWGSCIPGPTPSTPKGLCGISLVVKRQFSKL